MLFRSLHADSDDLLGDLCLTPLDTDNALLELPDTLLDDVFTCCLDLEEGDLCLTPLDTDAETFEPPDTLLDDVFSCCLALGGGDFCLTPLDTDAELFEAPDTPTDDLFTCFALGGGEGDSDDLNLESVSVTCVTLLADEPPEAPLDETVT